MPDIPCYACLFDDKIRDCQPGKCTDLDLWLLSLVEQPKKAKPRTVRVRNPRKAKGV